MKLKLKPASEMRKASKNKTEEKQERLSSLVKTFIDGKVRQAIEESETQFVNVEVPIEAYKFGEDFYKACQGALAPLGYTCNKSHDGGGMYDTLAVKW